MKGDHTGHRKEHLPLAVRRKVIYRNILHYSTLRVCFYGFTVTPGLVVLLRGTYQRLVCNLM